LPDHPHPNPPRNGEGDRLLAVEGSGAAGLILRLWCSGFDWPLHRKRGSPPRSGEDLVVEPTPEPKRKKHKTLGAPDSTVRMARKLRKEMSLPEVLLWVQLQQHPGGYLFRKQHPIGAYALDFCCVKARLAIEVDGESHSRGNRPERDAARDAWVLAQGFDTMRIPAVEVLKNMEGVLIAIVEECRVRLNPPRNGEVARSDGGAGLGSAQPLTVPPASTGPSTASGPPPRSGEDFK
jgi:very-short-patch-repair endonuclease